MPGYRQSDGHRRDWCLRVTYAWTASRWLSKEGAVSGSTHLGFATPTWMSYWQLGRLAFDLGGLEDVDL
jgi:hypothetical protein